MKSITLALAATLLAGTAAQAGSRITFEINGQRIHVEAPRNCDALSCIRITAPGLNLKDFNLGGSKADDDTTVASTTTAAPSTIPAPAGATPAPSSPDAAGVVASPAPATSAIAPSAPAPSADTPAPQPAQIAGTPAPTTPLGVWATEENKGNVRIEPCGANLCGYADKTNEKILINMKPSDNTWVGRIHDPDHGGNYNSTIAMKGPNMLKVQGCAFGGLFCGGQTWKRVG